jgi:hypothetical protein
MSKKANEEKAQGKQKDLWPLQNEMIDLVSMLRVTRDSAYVHSNGFAEKGERPPVSVLSNISDTLKIIIAKAESIERRMGD